MARRFLWVVAGLVVLVLIAALGYRLFGTELMRMAMVPTAQFEAAPPAAEGAYAKADMWISRPGIANDPSLWTPEGAAPVGGRGDASIFFIHPTSYLERGRWNAPLDDEESQTRARLFVRSQASALAAAGEVWAPKYRQATFGAFLTDKTDSKKALDLAYGDVAAAFESFLALAPKDRPIVLAAHSQGSLHLTRLLAERIAGRPEAKRIAAAYVAGWPVSMTADLPALGLPACETAEASGCILSWQSFGEPADAKLVTDAFDSTPGPTGMPRAGSPMLCVNPVTGTRNGTADKPASRGMLIPNKDFTEGKLKSPGVGARCDVRGFLLIGAAGEVPDLGPYVLPGHNYHVYDYALFWADIRADAVRRLKAFEGKK
ncbi:MAG TPA: DUF3089 domain-containing protein [Allosphingosinicella sp.]